MSAHVWSRMVLAFLALGVVTGRACEITVRDAAFRAARDVHRLCVIANEGDPAAKKTVERLSTWLEGPGQNLNVELVRVIADDPGIHWPSYGIPSAPPALPVVVLAGRDNGVGESFYVQHWDPAPSVEDLAALLSSPVRAALQQELGRRFAVLVYAPAAASDDAAAAMIEQAVQEWEQKNSLGVSIVRVDRSDERERSLLSFLGVKPDGRDWLGVVFGRGKLMSPPLRSENPTGGPPPEVPEPLISVKGIGELLEQLSLDCSCSKPLPSLGVDLPMLWDEQLDNEVVFIGDQEEIKESLPENFLPSMSTRLSSVIAQSKQGPDDGEAVPAPIPAPQPPVELSGDGFSVVWVVLWTAGVLAAFVIAGTAFLWIKGQRGTTG